MLEKRVQCIILYGVNRFLQWSTEAFKQFINVLLQVSYQEALAAIFIEGWIFIVLSLTGVRQGLIR